jgi:hypothetical protein
MRASRPNRRLELEQKRKLVSELKKKNVFARKPTP